MQMKIFESLLLLSLLALKLLINGVLIEHVPNGETRYFELPEHVKNWNDFKKWIGDKRIRGFHALDFSKLTSEEFGRLPSEVRSLLGSEQIEQLDRIAWDLGHAISGGEVDGGTDPLGLPPTVRHVKKPLGARISLGGLRNSAQPTAKRRHVAVANVSEQGSNVSNEEKYFSSISFANYGKTTSEGSCKIPPLGDHALFPNDEYYYREIIHADQQERRQQEMEEQPASLREDDTEDAIEEQFPLNTMDELTNTLLNIVTLGKGASKRKLKGKRTGGISTLSSLFFIGNTGVRGTLQGENENPNESNTVTSTNDLSSYGIGKGVVGTSETHGRIERRTYSSPAAANHVSRSTGHNSISRSSSVSSISDRSKLTTDLAPLDSLPFINLPILRGSPCGLGISGKPESLYHRPDTWGVHGQLDIGAELETDNIFNLDPLELPPDEGIFNFLEPFNQNLGHQRDGSWDSFNGTNDQERVSEDSPSRNSPSDAILSTAPPKGF